MGGSGILSPLEFGVNSWLCSLFSDGGSEILSPLQFGVNIRFYSVLNDGGDQKFCLMMGDQKF